MLVSTNNIYVIFDNFQACLFQKKICELQYIPVFRCCGELSLFVCTMGLDPGPGCLPLPLPPLPPNCCILSGLQVCFYYCRGLWTGRLVHCLLTFVRLSPTDPLSIGFQPGFADSDGSGPFWPDRAFLFDRIRPYNR